VVGCWHGYSVWGEVQICVRPSLCHCHSLSLAPVNPDWFHLFLVPAHLGSPGHSPEDCKTAAAAAAAQSHKIGFSLQNKHKILFSEGAVDGIMPGQLFYLTTPLLLHLLYLLSVVHQPVGHHLHSPVP